MSACQGCGAELAPNRHPGNPRKWCSERCRKQTLYAGTCVDCGARTNGYDGPGKAHERCVPCAAEASRHWTRETIVGALQAWGDLHDGEPPAARPWLQGTPAGMPSVATVQEVFGSWNAGIAAAGFVPRRLGNYGRDGEDNDLCRVIRERYEDGERSADLAEEYECSVTAIHYRIHKAGGVLRPVGRLRKVAA